MADEDGVEERDADALRVAVELALILVTTEDVTLPLSEDVAEKLALDE